MIRLLIESSERVVRAKINISMLRSQIEVASAGYQHIMRAQVNVSIVGIEANGSFLCYKRVFDT